MSLGPTRQGTSLQCQDLASLPGGAVGRRVCGDKQLPYPVSKGGLYTQLPAVCKRESQWDLYFPKF